MIENIIGLTHPMLVTIVIACVGGFYAKGRVIDAIFFGAIAPLFLVPTWFVAFLAAMLPLGFVHSEFPEAISYLSVSESWYAPIASAALDPYVVATVVATALFVLFCHYERINRAVRVAPPNYVGSRRFVSTPLSRPHLPAPHLPAPHSSAPRRS